MRTVIRNEFASVEVSVDETSGAKALRITDLRSGSKIELDSLELEALTRITHRHLEPFVDPNWIVFE